MRLDFTGFFFLSFRLTMSSNMGKKSFRKTERSLRQILLCAIFSLCHCIVDIEDGSAQANANLREGAARRRDTANQFNSQAGWEETKYGIDRMDSINAAAAKSQAEAPFNALKYQKEKLGLDKLVADQARTNAEFDASIRAKEDKPAEDFVKAEMDAAAKTGRPITREQAYEKWSQRNIAAGNTLNDTAGRTYKNEALEGLRRRINNPTLQDTQYEGLFDDSRNPFAWGLNNAQIDKDVLLDASQFEEFTPDTFANSARKFFGQKPVVGVRYKDPNLKAGMDYPTFYDEDGAPDIQRFRDLRKEGTSGR